MAKDTIIRHSRFAYLIEYTCAIFLAGLLLIAIIIKASLPRYFLYAILILALLCLATAELKRLYGDRYKIKETKMEIIQGVINVRKKTIYYHPLGFVPDINVHQSALKRFFDVGTIFIKEGTSKIEIKDVNAPHKVMTMLEGFIDKNRVLSKNKKEDEGH
jgi:membrane protein YdbS with pleckstrin-like domain